MTDGICFAGLDVHVRKAVAAAVKLGSGEVFMAQLSGGCGRGHVGRRGRRAGASLDERPTLS